MAMKVEGCHDEGARVIMREVKTLSTMEKALQVSKWEIFERLALDEVAMIAAQTEEVEYEAGEVIVPDGPTGSSLHLILRGSVELSIDGRPFRRAGAGSGFAGMAVLGEPLAGEEAKVLEPTHALLLSRKDFADALVEHPGLALAIIRGMARMIREYRRPPADGKERRDRR